VMSTAPRRPFSLLDAMVLVAATAVGLGAARGMHDILRDATDMDTPRLADPVGRSLLEAARWSALGYPLIVAWTLALVLLLFLSRRFRPSFKSLLERPGPTACAAAAMALAIQTINVITLAVVLMANNGTVFPSAVTARFLVLAVTPYLGVNLGMPRLAVTVAWTGLALSGRWQPEPNWLDRAGRLIGLAWVVLMVFQPWLISIVRGEWS
jgi:hypothetical protein